LRALLGREAASQARAAAPSLRIYQRRSDRVGMVLGLVVPAAVSFVFAAVAAYVGALRALEVYFDPDQDSVFLMDDRDPPRRQ
jgi:hypothetical protein